LRGERRHALAASGEAHLLARRRFQANPFNRQACDPRYARSHEIPMRPDAWSFAHHRDIEVRNAPAAPAHPIGGIGEEPIG